MNTDVRYQYLTEILILMHINTEVISLHGNFRKFSGKGQFQNCKL